MTLDEFDARILSELQSNSDSTSEAIGHRVGLSGSAVAKRLRKLNESGLVERHVAVLNLRLIGPSITALIICSFDPDGPLVRDEFTRLVSPRSEVTNIWVLTGEVDVGLTIVTRTLDECTQITRSLQENFPQLKNLKEYIVTAQPKRSLVVPFSLAGLALDIPG